MKFHQVSIERRCLFLKEIWEEHQKHNAVFLKDLCAKHRIGRLTITAMKELKIIKDSPKWGPGWYDWVIGEPNKPLAENIRNEEAKRFSLYVNKEVRKRQSSSVSQPAQASTPATPISLKSFSDQDIITELRSRGYSGSLQLTISI